MNQNGGLYNQYLEIKDHKVLVSFKGVVSQDILTEFGTMIKSSLSAETKTNRVFAVFIELAQNILHYSAERRITPVSDEGIGIILLKEKQDLFFLSSGNMVTNTSVEIIKAKCERVNAMNRDQLRAYHQELIRGGRPDGSKGAGLGIVDIARKCDSPVECTVNSVDDKISFLTLCVSFKKENQ